MKINLKEFKTILLLVSCFFMTSAFSQTFEIRHTANSSCTNISYDIWDAGGVNLLASGNTGSPPPTLCINGVPAFITYNKCGPQTLNVNSSQMVGCNPTCSPYNDNVTYVAGDPLVDPCDFILTINL